MIDRKSFSLVVAAILIVSAAWWWLSNRNSAPGTDSSGNGGPLVAVKQPESLSSAAQDGKVLFERTCAACHGQNAAGSDKGPPLIHKIYEPNHHADQAFLLAARTGVRQHHWTFGNMPAQPDVRDIEIAAIVTYVRELQRANGIF